MFRFEVAANPASACQRRGTPHAERLTEQRLSGQSPVEAINVAACLSHIPDAGRLEPGRMSIAQFALPKWPALAVGVPGEPVARAL